MIVSSPLANTDRMDSYDYQVVLAAFRKSKVSKT